MTMRGAFLNRGGAAATRPAVSLATAAAPQGAALRLQAALGNQGMQRLLRAQMGQAAQARIEVSEPHDAEEREAERVADEVMRMPEPGAAEISPKPAASVQRACAACSDQDERVARKEDEDGATEEAIARETDSAPGAPGGGEDPPAAPATSAVRALGLEARGDPLPSSERAFFEPRFAFDFSAVRIHAGPAADSAARAINARAFTSGSDIAFAAGQYAPGVAWGRHLLAHELTHVVQQSGGSAAGTVQRQEHEPSGDDWMSQLPGYTNPPPDFGTVTEPGCPRPPTRLGDVPPEPACATSEEEIDGSEFHFCMDSDVFRSADELSGLVRFARGVEADSIFTVHGFASDEGTPAYNLTLSCHRAKRAARELINAGVRSERIRIAAKGATRRFSDRARAQPTAPGAPRPRRDPALDRVVVISASASGTLVQPAPATDDRRRVVNQARALFANSFYRLGADAYLSYWSCGLVPSLSRAVELMTIRIEGEDNRFAPHGVSSSELGVDEIRSRPDASPVPNEIILAEATFSATNPLACAAARIADMTFHHMVRHVITDRHERHVAALFFVELAGLPPCESPEERLGAIVVTPARLWWQRPTVDPRQASPAPSCASPQLPGAVAPQPVPAAARAARPTFTVDSFRFDGGSGPVQTIVDPDANLVQSDSPRGAFQAAAEVTASGAPAVVPGYSVGFMQTIAADEELVDYADGRRVRVTLPVPIRDGPPGGVGAPWFDTRFLTPIDPSTGRASARLSDSPSERAHYQFVQPEMVNRPRRPGESLIETGNVLNRAVKRVTFKTWLCARRNDAPADPFNTVFLEGRTVTWEQNLDVIGTDATGTYTATIGPSASSDTAQMQLRGPTPADFPPLGPAAYRRLQTQVLPATPRAQAQGLDVDAYRAEVRRTADLLTPYRRALGLTDQLILRLHFDPDTGRLVVDPAALPVRACFDSDCEDRRLADERGLYTNQLLVRLRKDLVLAPQTDRFARHPYQFVVLSALPPIPRFADPFSPAHGLGLVGVIAEQQRMDESERRFRQDPDTFDPTFMPRVDVRFRGEDYRWDFTVSDMNIEDVCTSHELVAGCCVPQGLQETMSYEATPQPAVSQTRDGVAFSASPGVDIVFSPVRFTVFVPGNRLTDGETLNHELSHIVRNHLLLQIWKERLARTVRARLMETRRDAVQHPDIRGMLLEPATVRSIVSQEIPTFISAFGPEYTRVHDVIDSGRALPRVQLPPGWVMPRLVPGTRGSF